MKKLAAIILSTLFLGCASIADEKVVAVSVGDLQSSPKVLREHRYISTGQPDEALLSAVKEAGYVAVIDLRTASEDRGINEVEVVESLGMAYHSLPIAGAKGTTFDNARALAELMNSIDGPVLLHCLSGNRVGALLALHASETGASDAEALAIGKNAGMTRLEGRVKELLAEE